MESSLNAHRSSSVKSATSLAMSRRPFRRTKGLPTLQRRVFVIKDDRQSTGFVMLPAVLFLTAWLAPRAPWLRLEPGGFLAALGAGLESYRNWTVLVLESDPNCTAAGPAFLDSS